MMARRAEIHERYVDALGAIDGIEFMPVPEGSEPNRWLTVLTIDPEAAGTDREAIRLGLEEHNIESRPAWKPMHLQPLFAGAEMVGGSVSEAVFADGLCLPSGSSLTDGDLDRVLDIVTTQLRL